MAEQQVIELTESVNRLKSQLQDTEKQLLRLNQNEQKFKQECEQIRIELSESQKREENIRNDLTKYKDKVTKMKIQSNNEENTSIRSRSAMKIFAISCGKISLEIKMKNLMKKKIIFRQKSTNFVNN